MEGVIGIIGFSLGASLSMAIVRTASQGLRPLVKGAIKAGLAVTDTVQGVGSKASDTLITARSEIQADTNAAHTDADGETSPRSRRRSRPAAQKIVIATE